MRFDPPSTRFVESAAAPAASDAQRRCFAAELNELELRLAIVDDRFERLATRPERDYRDWRSDTVTRMRALAEHAGLLQRAASLPTGQRDRAAAVLATLRHRLGALERRRTVLQSANRAER